MGIIKSLFLENWEKLLIAVLVVIIFKGCGSKNELQLANLKLKNEVKQLVVSADKYVAKNNELNGKIVLLKQQKQKVKNEIVYIENKTKSDIKKVPTLNTKQIANYYQERYKLPVTITQHGVSLSDTIAKKNIVELIQKDGCFQEVKLVQSELQIEEQKGIFKDTIIGNLDKSNLLLNKAILEQEKIITNTEKSLKTEKRKKTFWKVATGTVLASASYLLIQK